MWTISLQYRRIQSAEPEDGNFVFRIWADFDFLIVALIRLRRVVKLAAKIPEINPEITKALGEFDSALPNLKTMRDVAEHIDDYAVDSGWKEDISRKMLEVSKIKGTELEWLNYKLDAREALKSSEKLFKVLKENVPSGKK